jgi:nucleoid-associated protein YgaU
MVKPGERLDLIAHEEYGDSTLWRVIADANGLLSIRDLTVGQRLAIPPLR